MPDALRNPHPLIKVTLDALSGNTAVQHDGYLGNWQVRHLDVQVTPPLLKRAIRILDTVVKAFQARGWEVSLGRDDSNSYVTIYGQRVPFGIREPEARSRELEIARRDAQRRRDAETARVKAIEDQAERWLRSRTIREYTAAIRNAAAAQGVAIDSGDLATWLEWAEARPRHRSN